MSKNKSQNESLEETEKPLIGHFFGDTYKRITHLESAKSCHKDGINYVTWDIGITYKDLEKEVKDFYTNNNYNLFKDKIQDTKFTFVKKL